MGAFDEVRTMYYCLEIAGFSEDFNISYTCVRSVSLKTVYSFFFFYRTIVYDNSPTLYTLTHRERTTL